MICRAHNSSLPRFIYTNVSEESLNHILEKKYAEFKLLCGAIRRFLRELIFLRSCPPF